jgi:CubicO group peptidase (beta-lactamase class C family)
MKRYAKRAAALFALLLMLFCICPNTVTADTDYNTIDKQLAENVRRYHVPAMAVVEVSSEEVLFEGCYGECTSADQDFIIGSLSKSYTAVAIMQLEEDGKVDLDSPITEYIDCSGYFKQDTPYERITVRDLLNQTSGITTYDTLGSLESTDCYGTHVYANANYSLLGIIVENVTGLSYEEYMTANVFSPLSMDNTYASLSDAAVSNMVPGYRNFFGIQIAGAPDYPKTVSEASWTSVPGGYLISSASDMGKYLQMYLRGGEGVLDPSSIEKMFYDNVPGEDEGEFYGMGWICSEENGHVKLMHTGLVENYVSMMYIYPEEDRAGIVLIDMNDYLVNNMYLDHIIAPLTGADLEDSSNMYWIMHGAIDAVCMILLVIALYPILTMRKWRNGKRNIVTDVIRHLLLPAVLIAAMLFMAPAFVIWLFAKDVFIVITATVFLLILTGIFKLASILCSQKAYNER